MFFPIPPKPGQPIRTGVYSHHNTRQQQLQQQQYQQQQQRQPQYQYQYNFQPIYKSYAQASKTKHSNKSTISHQRTFNHASYAKIPTDVFDITRKQFCLIKCFHHITILRQAIPKTWNNWKKNILDNLRLAFANDASTKAITNLSDNYFSSLQNAAIQHYLTTITEATQYLVANSGRMSAKTYSKSISLVTKWARNQLGHKLTEETLTMATQVINSSYKPSLPTNAEPSSVSHRQVIINQEENSSGEGLTITVTNNLNEEEIPSPSRAAQPSSKKQVKPNNSSRFFLHSQQHEEVISDEIPTSIPISLSQTSTTSLSQSSILSFTDGASSSQGVTSFKLSMEETAREMSKTAASTVLLGDQNWYDYFPRKTDSEFNCFICSGKVTAIRAILDKIKTNLPNIKRFILCFSSNNLDSNSSISLLRNINSALINKFKSANIFICLAGICKSLTSDNAKKLESINMTIRNKSEKYILVNPPDEFSTTDGHNFTNATKNIFYNTLDSFLA